MQQFQEQKDELEPVFSGAKPYAFTIIIAMNVVIFIVMALQSSTVMNFTSDTLLQWGADYAPKTIAKQEWWRVFTSFWIHGGIIHLFLNMYALFSVGFLAEQLLGTKRFTLVYLLCGIGGSVASLWWNQDIVSVGASGAVFGVFGIILGFFTATDNQILQQQRSTLLQNIGVVVAANIVYGLSTENIDNAAHGGGLVTGLLLGFYFARVPNLRTTFTLVQVAVLSALLAVCAFILSTIHAPTMGFRDAVEKLGTNEQRAIALYNNGVQALTNSRVLPNTIPDQDTAIQLWKENITLTQQFSTRFPAGYSYEKALTRYYQLSLERNTTLRAILKGDSINPNRIGEIVSEIERVQTQLEQIQKK